MKTILSFECEDFLKLFIAYQVTRDRFFIGRKDRFYHPYEVELKPERRRDPITGWKNYRSVILDGKIIGHCGE